MWVRYENCHIVIFLSYILIHDHFPFLCFIYLFYFIYFILFILFIYFDIPPKRAVERILFPHKHKSKIRLDMTKYCCL